MGIKGDAFCGVPRSPGGYTPGAVPKRPAPCSSLPQNTIPVPGGAGRPGRRGRSRKLRHSLSTVHGKARYPGPGLTYPVQSGSLWQRFFPVGGGILYAGRHRMAQTTPVGCRVRGQPGHSRYPRHKQGRRRPGSFPFYQDSHSTDALPRQSAFPFWGNRTPSTDSMPFGVSSMEDRRCWYVSISC